MRVPTRGVPAAVAEPLPGLDALDHAGRVVDAAVPAGVRRQLHVTFPLAPVLLVVLVLLTLLPILV